MNPATFDLNLIRALDALLAETNVTRAAAHLHVTQQAMSGSLRRLRQHFSDDLLVTVGRRLELTPLGAALQEPVRELMLQFGQTLKVTPQFDPVTSKRPASATSFVSLLFMVPGTRLIATAQRKLVNAFSVMLPIRCLACPIAIELLHADLSRHSRHEFDPAHQFVRSLFAEAAELLRYNPHL